MCLNNSSEEKIATEDIVCWKRLCEGYDNEFNSSLLHVESKTDFTGIINGKKVKGKIYNRNGKIIYLFTNIKLFNGNRPSSDEDFDYYGYKYSWELDNQVESLVINGKEYFREKKVMTPYYNMQVKEGETYTSKLETWQRDPSNRVVEKGLHTYQLEKEVIDSPIYARCTIPKGSKYYEGYFDHKLAYASDTLRYDEIKIIKI